MSVPNMDEKREQLELLLTKIQEYSKISDPEDSHTDADEVLLEVISVLTENTPLQELGKKIISCFEGMEKWYA